MRGRRLVLGLVGVVALVALDVGGLRVALGLVGDQGSGREVRIAVGRWPCEEDEPYLLGRGDYDGQRWARYRCVHVEEMG